MRTLLLLQRPLSRRTVVFCHVMVQLSWLLGGSAWLAFHSPWLSTFSWAEAGPPMLMGGGVMVLAMIATRLLAELIMIPHYIAAMREGFASSSVMTRSYDRRPAVHNSDEAWTSASQSLDGEDTVLGQARVTQPAKPGRWRKREEPSPQPVSSGEGATPRKEPRL